MPNGKARLCINSDYIILLANNQVLKRSNILLVAVNIIVVNRTVGHCTIKITNVALVKTILFIG